MGLWVKQRKQGRGTQERIKLAPSQAHTYNNPAVNYLFVQATVTTFLVTEASAGVALAMSWQIQNRRTRKKKKKENAPCSQKVSVGNTRRKIL